jgi:hypothetical protein
MFKIRQLAVFALALLAADAGLPPTPKDVTVIQSKKFPGVSISFKQVGHEFEAIGYSEAHQDADKHLRDNERSQGL